MPLNLPETAANSGVFTAMVPGAVPVEAKVTLSQPSLILATTETDRFTAMIEGSSDLGGVGAAASDGTLLATLETQLKEARITLVQWMEACGVVLNRAAVACESADSAPTSLVNAGWTLRRGRSPSHEMPAPAGLRLKQTAFAGEGVVRWRVVPNANFYEVQVDPVAGAELTISESVVLKSVRGSVVLPTVAPGSLVTLCVRAVGAKGAGPFCDALTVRVN